MKTSGTPVQVSVPKIVLSLVYQQRCLEFAFAELKVFVADLSVAFQKVIGCLRSRKESQYID